MTATKICAGRTWPVSRSTNHWHRVAGIIDKQLVAADVGLPHGDRQPRYPTAVQLAEARIAIPRGMALDVLVPRHCHVTCLRLSSRWISAQSGST
jgi:hypothetical protein